MQAIRRQFSYANVMATVAVFLALGGSAYAFTLGKNSVKSKNIAKGAVKSSDIAKGAVSASKLKAGAVPASVIADGSVSAAKWGNVVKRSATAQLNDGTNQTVKAACQPGEKLVGNGTYTDASNSSDLILNKVEPETATHNFVPDGSAAQGVSADWDNTAGMTGTATITAWVLCLQ